MLRSLLDAQIHYKEMTLINLLCKLDNNNTMNALGCFGHYTDSCKVGSTVIIYHSINYSLINDHINHNYCIHISIS